jgi:hypothetical protein
MINRGIWSKVHWKAVGVGIYQGYACVWFGEEEDPHSYEPMFIDLSGELSAAK